MKTFLIIRNCLVLFISFSALGYSQSHKIELKIKQRHVTETETMTKLLMKDPLSDSTWIVTLTSLGDTTFFDLSKVRSQKWHRPFIYLIKKDVSIQTKASSTRVGSGVNLQFMSNSKIYLVDPSNPESLRIIDDSISFDLVQESGKTLPNLFTTSGVSYVRGTWTDSKLIIMSGNSIILNNSGLFVEAKHLVFRKK